MDLIIYHGHCPDGFTAAYIATLRYPEAAHMALDHGLTAKQIDAVVDAAKGKNVLMLDYSLRKREDNDRIAEAAKSFWIIDHHKTAQATLEGASYATFDMNRSGAGLAWDELFGPIKLEIYEDCEPTGRFMESEGMPRPWWVNYTEARDLWRWDSLPNSKAICAFLGTLPFTVAAYDQLQVMSAEEALVLGQGALAHIEHYVRESTNYARQGVLYAPKNGMDWAWNVTVLNVTYLNCSEVGNELAKRGEASLTWFERADDQIQFSLRSIGDNDVSEIAKHFGGGGHKNAAGFQMGITDGRHFIDKILGRSEGW